MELNTLFQDRRRLRKLALFAEHQPQYIERVSQAIHAQAPAITLGALSRQRLFQQCRRLLVLPHNASLARRVAKELRLILGLPQGAAQRRTLLEELGGTRIVVLIGGQPRRRMQGTDPRGRSRGARGVVSRQQLLQPAAPLAEIPSALPEFSERPTELEAQRALAAVAGPL